MKKIIVTLTTLGLLTVGFTATQAQAGVINTFWDFTGTAPASNTVGELGHTFLNDTITLDMNAAARTKTTYTPQGSSGSETVLTGGFLYNMNIAPPPTPSSLGVGTDKENVLLKNRINIYNAGTISVDDQTEDGHNLASLFPGVTTFDVFKQDFVYLNLFPIYQFIQAYAITNYTLELTLDGVFPGNEALIDMATSNLVLPTTTPDSFSSNTIDITSYLNQDYLYISNFSPIGIQLVSMRFSFEECGLYKNCNPGGGGDDGGGGGGDDGGGDGDQVPEPGVVALLGFSLAGLAMLRRKQ